MDGHIPERAERVTYEDYIHELPERYASAPLIKHLEMLQLQANGIWDESQLQEVWHSTQGLLENFRTQADEQGLINQMVVLEGDGIKIPQMSLDVRSGQYMVAHEDVPGLNSDTFVQYQTTHEVVGFLVGFSLTFTEVSPGSKRYRPQFVYQVSTGMTIQTPHGVVPLYTTAIVGQTNLRFMEDERRDIIAEMANKLYELVPNERGSIYRVIETVMMKHHEDGSLWRHLGHHAEQVVSGAAHDQKVRVGDMLVKLISSTFVEQQDVMLLTGEYTRQFNDKFKEREYYSDEDEVGLIDGEVRGVIFLDDGARLNMVIGRPGEVVLVPVKSISEYDRG